MMVPVKHEGKVVGVVQVMTAQTAFSAEQLEIAGGLVALMGAADRNAQAARGAPPARGGRGDRAAPWPPSASAERACSRQSATGSSSSTPRV